MTLRIKLFGSLELERDGRPLDRFASRKSGELFAYLALNRKALHTREHLAGVFWGDSTEERARHTLNTTLWRINRVLEPPQCTASERGYLRVSPQHIGFNAASGAWLDVAEFEARCELAEQTHAPTKYALYAQAVNLYRGDLLADCYEDWCIVERERLQGLYVRALAQLMAFNAGNAEYDLAIDCARRILTCDPLREEVHRDLMRLHLQAGQPAAALRQYRQCEDMLRDELGVEPAPETRALLTPILSPGSDPGPPTLKTGARNSSVTPNDLAAIAAKIEHLSAACDAARDQLQEAMALLRELTDDLRTDHTLVPLHAVTRHAVTRRPARADSSRAAPPPADPRPFPNAHPPSPPRRDVPRAQPLASHAGDFQGAEPLEPPEGKDPRGAQRSRVYLAAPSGDYPGADSLEPPEGNDPRGAQRTRVSLAAASGDYPVVEPLEPPQRKDPRGAQRSRVPLAAAQR